ncbi:hypothetical protein AF72_09995 [Xylella taiwanensis]|uniref:Uncharacterized protein n=1 Tax=Xylella taiwanensis TaxID=1444770 RepID=Z9JHH6_9GAMM|nr:hypothetical protein AF72_09995 [Xylella taiwanensis]
MSPLITQDCWYCDYLDVLVERMVVVFRIVRQIIIDRVDGRDSAVYVVFFLRGAKHNA